MRIALLEDDPLQAKLVKSWLENAGHVCYWHERGEDLINTMHRESFDLYLLDWELPGLSGIEVLEWIRANFEDARPVLFTTARSAEQDVVMALSMGADDFLTKPLRQQELLARIDVLERRNRRSVAHAVLDFGAYHIDCGKRQIEYAGEAVLMTAKEFDLALFLFTNHSRLLSRGHLLESVWGARSEQETRTVDAHISRLRKKLNLSVETGWKLTSVHKFGYRLEKLFTE